MFVGRSLSHTAAVCINQQAKQFTYVCIVINMVVAFYARCHAGLCGIAEVYEGKQAASGECRMSGANWPNAGKLVM